MWRRTHKPICERKGFLLFTKQHESLTYCLFKIHSDVHINLYVLHQLLFLLTLRNSFVLSMIFVHSIHSLHSLPQPSLHVTSMYLKFYLTPCKHVRRNLLLFCIYIDNQPESFSQFYSKSFLCNRSNLIVVTYYISSFCDIIQLLIFNSIIFSMINYHFAQFIFVSDSALKRKAVKGNETFENLRLRVCKSRSTPTYSQFFRQSQNVEHNFTVRYSQFVHLSWFLCRNRIRMSSTVLIHKSPI